jgi:signal transduction histidine kinase
MNIRPLRRFWPQQVRARLTLIYAALFFTAGLALLALTYGLVASNLPSAPPTTATTGDQQLKESLGRECQPSASWRKGDPPPIPGPLLEVCKLAEAAFHAGADSGSQTQRQRALDELLVFSFVGLGLMTAASGSLGWFMSGRVLRPVRVITDTARRASEEHLGERLLTDMATRVRHSIERAESMIEALLTLAVSDQGKLSTEFTDLATCAEDAIDAAAPEIERLELRVDASLDPAELAGDPQLLERMIWNLVDNAVRHNEPGGWIRLRTGRDDATVYLEIANSGPVIPDGAVPSLFEPFRRMAARTGVRDGAGLGLSIARSVVTAHHASVTTRSQPAGGLHVSVVIPHARTREACR